MFIGEIRHYHNTQSAVKTTSFTLQADFCSALESYDCGNRWSIQVTDNQISELKSQKRRRILGN